MKNSYVSIHPGAKLGKHVVVENFSTIEEDVVIGEHTWIGPHVTILSGSRIGAYCHIFAGAIIGSSTQGKKKPTQPTHLYIGHHTTIREFTTLNKGALDDTVIGNHTLLMAYVHVGHDCRIDDHVVVANGTQLAGHVRVGEHAVIGGMTAIHQFAHIGPYSMVASKSIVRKDVPPFIRVAREPLQYCGLNRIALERHRFSDVQYTRIQKMYHLIYQNKWPLKIALQQIKDKVTDGVEKNMVLSFIEKSEKGIVKKNDCQ